MSRNTFRPVFDSRKRRVPGIYVRGERYYGQLWVTTESGGKTARKFPLKLDGEPVRGVAEAKEAFDILKQSRRTDALPPARSRKGMLFADYVVTYQQSAFSRVKRSGTLRREKLGLDNLAAHFAGVRLDAVSLPSVRVYCEKRLAGTFSTRGKVLKKCSIRTVNIDLTTLRQCLKSALADGLIAKLPEIRNLDAPPPRVKELVTSAELSALLAAVPQVCSRNAGQVSDYLRFLAYSGAREREALAVKWRDVDLSGKKLTIGADGQAKNGLRRVIDMSAPLIELLTVMKSAAADSAYLFPSPKRKPGTDRPAKTLRSSMELARDAAGLPWFAFHHLRHYFASCCIMSGIDYMTTALWLGHQDGGVLVGKVYGHLRDEHKQSMAAKLIL